MTFIKHIFLALVLSTSLDPNNRVVGQEDPNNSSSTIGKYDSSVTVQFHGSGTTNPDRCYWHILESIMSQTKIPSWLTYRSTSSGPGQEEFMGNITHPFTHFASSDYPLPKLLYESLRNAGKEMIHLPVMVSAIGVFHSVPLKHPNAPLDVIDLNLTSCLVARIYQGDIVDWNHPEIVEVNPNLDLPVAVNNYGKPKEEQIFPIQVVHRDMGSSSTYALTAYLHKSCPEHWGEQLVGNTIDWPLTGDDRFILAQGTSTMIASILGTPGAIGFADAGLAFDQGVAEAALKMDQVSIKGGFYLTTRDALKKNGVSATLDANGTNIPTRGDADWSGVDLINQVEVRSSTTIASRDSNQPFVPSNLVQILCLLELTTHRDTSILGLWY